MSRLATAWVMLAAIFGLGATVVVAASAEEGLLPLKVPLTGTGGTSTLEDTKGNKVSCTSSTLLGTEFATDRTGTFADLHFKGCKAFGLFGANSVLDETAVVLTGSGTLGICLIDSTTLEFGVFLAFDKTIVIEVPAAKDKVEIKGSLIGALSPNNLGEVKTATFSVTKGMAGIKECEGKKAQLLISLNGGAFIEAGKATTETLRATNGKTELELMDT
jgi:hypothetical protein